MIIKIYQYVLLFGTYTPTITETVSFFLYSYRLNTQLFLSFFNILSLKFNQINKFNNNIWLQIFLFYSIIIKNLSQHVGVFSQAVTTWVSL